MEAGPAWDDCGCVFLPELAVMWIPPLPLEPAPPCSRGLSCAAVPFERRPPVYRLVALAALALLLGG